MTISDLTANLQNLRNFVSGDSFHKARTDYKDKVEDLKKFFDEDVHYLAKHLYDQLSFEDQKLLDIVKHEDITDLTNIERMRLKSAIITAQAKSLTNLTAKTTSEDKKEMKFTSRSANREIEKLLNDMIQRKQLRNNVRMLEVELVTDDDRNSIMYVDGRKILLLNVDGEGHLEFYIPEDGTKNLFRFIILPLMDNLNDYLEGLDISISNEKQNDGQKTKAFAFNATKQMYVSSSQIQNKPANPGDTVVFTNLSKGRFKVL